MTAYSGPWHNPSETSSLSITGELSTEAGFAPSPQEGRRTERLTVEFGGGLRQRGASGVPVQIMDLSTDGFRAVTHLDLCTGTDVWLRLPGLEPCHARVVWSEGQSAGCAFVRALHPAVLEMIVVKAGKG